MRTVKEISELTGISVRTLHYYDEIGLLKPTDKSEAGYRLYDDKALETLQQILFFREFDISLKEIKSVLDNPVLERNQILQSQKKMLEAKKERLERLLSSIDDILKGENRMDFEAFSKDDIEELYQALVSNMSEEQKETFMDSFVAASAALTKEQKKQFVENGRDTEEFHKLYLQSASSRQAQESFKKVLEWYGDKESFVEAAKAPKDSRIMDAYRKRLEVVMKKLAEKRGQDVNSFAVKEVVGEYDFVLKQLYQMKDVKALMLDFAKSYQTDEAMKRALDNRYGEGTAAFYASAFRAFYKE